jgi:hypothetical protein
MKYIIIFSIAVYAVFNPQDSKKTFSAVVDGANQLAVEKMAEMPEVQRAVKMKLNALNEREI